MAIRDITQYERGTAISSPHAQVEATAYFDAVRGDGPLYETATDFHQVVPGAGRVVPMNAPLLHTVEIVPPKENGEQQ
jgi:hypothetical protein